MPRPTKLKGASVGRGRERTKRTQKRPAGKKKKIASFDYDEYNRMEHWKISTSTKEENKRSNPVQQKMIGGRRKALKRYMKLAATTGDKRQRAKELAKRIEQAESAKRGRGNRARSRKSWSIWGARNDNEKKNDHKVIGRVMKWADNEVARATKKKAKIGKFNPKGIASPKRLKRESRRRVSFADKIVTSVQMRPTADDKKKHFINSDDEKRARQDKPMCPAMRQYKREYRRQQRYLRKKMKASEGEAKNENNWIEVKKTRKTNKLASEEVSSVQCSNEFEALKDATISLPCQEESDNDEHNELQ